MSYQAFRYEELNEATIAKITICRPKALNAMNPQFFTEFRQIFDHIKAQEHIRVVVIVGEGKIFCAGLDLKEYGSLFAYDVSETDSARVSAKLYQVIREMQKVLLQVMHCRVPVLAGVHSKCIGGGIDLISLCDIRYCSSDAEYAIKQIDIGMAADLGTLQCFPSIVGSESTFRELAYTGRFMKAEQALRIGLVTRVLPSRQEMEKQLMATAAKIASKSPVGIYTLKQVFKRQVIRQIEDSLDYIARTNSASLLTKDTTEAITAFMQKRKPSFSKL